jgi:transcriptional regulator of acetoin/glycerol metabolism
VRELKSVIEAVVVASSDGDLAGDLSIRQFLTAGAARKNGTLPELERLEIKRVLEACRGNRTEAARQLGISRKTLYQKLRNLKIP